MNKYTTQFLMQLTAIIWLVSITSGLAQPCTRRAPVWAGAVDSCFNVGTGCDVAAFALITQPDGKILVGGGFSNYKSRPFNRLVRLDSLGNPDPGFSGGSFFNQNDGWVYGLALQPDGKILVVGGFVGVGPNSARAIVRLNADGTFDPTFNSVRFDFRIICVALQPDGKIIVGGDFTDQGTRIARLMPNGALDPSFSSGRGFDDAVNALAIQPDGKILVAGAFLNYNSVSRRKIARLNENGQLDTTFKPNQGAEADIKAIVLQPNGKIIAGGNFRRYRGVDRLYVARINPDGTLDATYANPNLNGHVQSLALQTDGKVLIGGSFNNVSDGIVRFDSAGRIANQFGWGVRDPNGNYFSVNAINALPNGKVTLAGEFIQFNANPRRNLVRFFANPSPVAGLPGDVSEKFSLKAVPNPATGAFYLQGQKRPGRIELFNSTGRLVHVQVAQPGQVISAKGFPAGLYHWRMGSEHGKLILE